ncbi:MAG: hypothetical protein U9R19_14605 [Bacteroidota bacterium]|nr:hypothetical protein [Bacteroidota bacterium]
MKSKLMFLMAILFCLGFSAFAQDVDVENNINTPYGIDATYEFNGSQIVNNTTVGAGGITTIEYQCPTDSDYELVSFTIKATGCQSSIAATHSYSTYSTELIEDCNQCENNGYSVYYLPQQGNRKAEIDCKD